MGKINKEMVASIIRAILMVLTTLVGFSILDVPIINQLIDALNHITGNLDAVWGAGNIIVTFILGLISQFVDTANGSAKTAYMSAKRFDYRAAA